MLKKLNLEGKVKLTPSTNDIQAAFMLGDVIVMPSVNPEPFGRIIIAKNRAKEKLCERNSIIIQKIIECR